MFVVLARTVILYSVLIVGLRLLGKRQLGELEPAELTLTLIIADLASVPMEDNGISLLTGIIPIVTLLCLNTILWVISAKSIRFRNLLCGRPSIVIENGRVIERELRRSRLTVDEIFEELRIQGYTDPNSVQYAVLESNGQLSVLLKSSEEPVTAGQMGVQTKQTDLPIIVISDGRLLSDRLKELNFDRQWLTKQLLRYGTNSPKDVFLMTADKHGNTYCIRKECVK